MKRTALVLKALAVALTIVALNAQPHAQTGERGMALKPVSELPSKAKRWALVIGVDQYRDRQIGQLGGAANDARVLAQALTAYAGFPADQVILLATDQPEERQPTRVNILRRLSNLAAVVPKDGLLLVSFSGHGMERAGQAYLLPSDAQISEDISFLEDTAISVARMHERIRATGARQVLILLDACRNDPGGRADAPNPLTEGFVKGFNFDVRNSEVQAFATLYATDVGQRAYEYTEKKQGYFTWALVEGLKGAAANGRGEITLSSLVNYVQALVPKRIGVDLGTGKQQHPFAVVEGYKAEDLVIAVSGQNVTVTVNTTNAPSAPDPATIELSYWETIKNSTDPADFKSYLKKYPNGQFADLARRRAGLSRNQPEPNRTEPARNQPESTTTSDAPERVKPDDNGATHSPTKGSGVMSGGVLNGKAISKPQPAYPPIAKAARASGVVTVQITVNENGDVISAHAVSGHPLLQAAAVQAAYQAKFSPTLLSGVRVKVTGIVTYNFILQ